MSDFMPEEELLAAIDMGSNSFHLAIARLDHGEVRKVASMSEKVQLAAGLDENNVLSETAMQRGLDCLTRFVARLATVPPSRLRIVATNALRQAENSAVFIERAMQILPKPIEIIAGREEARLIYLGVSQTMADQGRRLVVDIGGGSTEFIIGQDFEPLQTESLQMGCVAYTKAFFDDGVISLRQFDRAVAAARKEVMAIAATYCATGWDNVVGSSGTIKAARQILVTQGWSDDQERITREGLHKLRERVLACKHIDDIHFEGLREDRKGVLPAGLAILCAVFEELKLQQMCYSDGALREGVMYDLLGRFRHEDVRDRSVQAMMARYHVDVRQGERVATTARVLFEQMCEPAGLDEEDGDLLRRAAYLHEIGLAISHGGYHRHGAYLLQHSDVPGFSQVDQGRLSLLVGLHRRKLRDDAQVQVMRSGGPRLRDLCLLLRLAVLLHHGRSDLALPVVQLSLAAPDVWQVDVFAVAQDWPLLMADLMEETVQFKHWGITLDVRVTEASA
ncbi:MAG: exopolyphosphatase [Pseudomonadota bacterium]|jgi:exopolyphosphatase/guanosine-5'-triphosphate,3'-diphosphate pyrophosphatase